jgi:O-antigen ligase
VIAVPRIGISRSLLVGLALGCIGIGLLSGVNPEYGIVAAAGLTFAVVVIMDLTAGFVLFTGFSFLDLASSSGSFSGTKVIGVILFLSWLGHLATTRGRDLALFIRDHPALVFSLGAMLGWSALSFAWAESPGTALSGAFRYVLVMMLIPIAYAAIRERRHVGWVVAAFVLGAVLSSVYGFIDPASAVQNRLTGTIGDPNEEGAVLAAAIPLIVCLVAASRYSGAGSAHYTRMKIAGVVGATILFAGLVETLSRGALVSFGAVLVAAVVFGGRWRRYATALLLVGVVVTGGYFFVFAPLAARQRVTMSTTDDRFSIWTVALRVFDAHPVLGVGLDNFILVEGQYVNQPGAIEERFSIIDIPHVAHDTYLEALVDTGIPGLLALLAVIGCCVGAVMRATRIFERLQDRQMELLSRGVFLSLVATLTSDVFVSSGLAKSLWILLALCPVLLGFARRAEGQTRAHGQIRAARA